MISFLLDKFQFTFFFVFFPHRLASINAVYSNLMTMIICRKYNMQIILMVSFIEKNRNKCHKNIEKVDQKHGFKSIRKWFSNYNHTIWQKLLSIGLFSSFESQCDRYSCTYFANLLN